MKNSVNEQEQKRLDKLERLEEWRNGQLWYLQSYQSSYLRWLQMAVVAEQADELYTKQMNQPPDATFWNSVNDNTDLLCAACDAMNEVIAAVMREALFFRPPETGGGRR